MDLDLFEFSYLTLQIWCWLCPLSWWRSVVTCLSDNTKVLIVKIRRIYIIPGAAALTNSDPEDFQSPFCPWDHSLLDRSYYYCLQYQLNQACHYLVWKEWWPSSKQIPPGQCLAPCTCPARCWGWWGRRPGRGRGRGTGRGRKWWRSAEANTTEWSKAKRALTSSPPVAGPGINILLSVTFSITISSSHLITARQSGEGG